MQATGYVLIMTGIIFGFLIAATAVVLGPDAFTKIVGILLGGLSVYVGWMVTCKFANWKAGEKV